MVRLTVVGVTFAFFFTEAIIHYNMGVANGEKVDWHIPPGKELLKIGGIVGAFSIGSGLTVSALEKYLDAKDIEYENGTELLYI
jgi:hypothetical protein